MDIQIKVDDGALMRRFDLTEKNVQWVTSRAVNNTLIRAQRAQQNRMERTYTIRRKSLLRYSVKMIQFARPPRLTGIVGINPHPRLKAIWNKFEDGTPKTPSRSSKLAVPQAIPQKASGGISKAKRPKNLRRGFRIRSGGQGMVLQRRGRGRNSSLRLAYSLVRQVQTPANLRLVDTVRQTIDRHWADAMGEAIGRELRRNGLS